jgi:predicted Rossmann fold flavoprotein
MCAIEAGKRHRQVLVLDHANEPGRKILVSGGGQCNFTNIEISADHYLSRNPHFCKSALSRYTQRDFLQLVRKHHVRFSERTHGRLFCDCSSRDILQMLLEECTEAGVVFRLGVEIEKVERLGERQFRIHSSQGIFLCQSLVVATGGLSMAAIGASPIGYEIAGQFGIKVWPRRPGLVPITLYPKDLEKLSALSGIAVNSEVRSKRHCFSDSILFTHRGLSGPAILQVSLYWQPGVELEINLLPEVDLVRALEERKQQHPHCRVKSVLADYLPKRLVAALVRGDLAERPLKAITRGQLEELSAQLQQWTVMPSGTEGYETAEVTLGGVDCNAVSSKTMEANQVAGLFFTGEVLDVSGELGGYNLQWAWSSGWCAGQYA